MARPTKERRVEYIPEIKYFKPAAIPMSEIQEVSLTIEEIEAIRLKDLEGLNQEEAAEKMNVSRPTFQRILVEARKKIAESLIEGKAIRFQGGDYRLAEDIHCPRCGKDFKKEKYRRNRRGNRRQSGYCPQCDD
ncbi:MAG: DUF134 domain-containing protein [Halanaerobiales bacterium]